MADKWLEDLSDGLTRTALTTATNIPMVGDTIEAMLGGTGTSGGAVATAPAVEIERSGIPYIMEIVGVKGSPPEQKKAILFGSTTTSVAKGYAIIIALILLIGAAIYYLTRPEKRKARRRGRRANN